MVSSSGKDVDLTDTTVVVNNLLNTLFSQCTVMVNGVPVTQSHEHYNFRAYLETPLTYGTDAASSHLSYSYFTWITGICSLAIPRQRRTLPPQTTDS